MRVFRSLALWRTATALAALAIWLARISAPQSPLAQMPPVGGEAASGQAVTTLAREDGSPGWLAAVDPVHGTVLVVPVPSAPGAQGRVPELWIIPAGKARRARSGSS